jgi:hypothetical protein
MSRCCCTDGINPPVDPILDDQPFEPQESEEEGISVPGRTRGLPARGEVGDLLSVCPRGCYIGPRQGDFGRRDNAKERVQAKFFVTKRGGCIVV